MDTFLGIFSAFGLSASAGLNAYIPLLVVGAISHYFPNLLNLTQPWDLIASPWILILLGVLVIIEMLADKVPAVNHLNDVIQTFIRPAAGAIAFAASAKVITDIHPIVALACGLLVAGTVHTAKSAVVRPIVTATTGGAGNVPVSIAEDVVSTIVSILAIVLPVIMAILIIILAVLVYLWWSGRKDKRQTA
ncbi:MAG: DUF4126 domain-containing protein [Anaerolineales bacterium]|nr:DUF4126 domain-containing protein [Anaerolineales bacterium]MCZ2122395.1 DUF4126 domain-containing protein [Anaerolineales bacterium]